MEHNSSYNDDLKEISKRKIEEYAGAIAYTLVIIVFGILGNIMSVIFYGFKVQRTTTHVIITGLAIVDLIACVLFSDLTVELCFTVTFKNKPGCKVMNFLNYWLETTSGYMLLFVAFDRYRKICRPFAWQFSIKSIHISFLVIVIAAMVYSVRYLIMFDVLHVNVTDAESDKTIEVFYCTHSNDPELKTVITFFHVLDLLTFIAIICGCISLYSLISRALWLSRKHTKHINKGEGRSKDGHQERASTNSSYTGVRNTGEKSSYDTRSDNIKNDAVKHTKHPSCVLPNQDEISHEKLDSNADSLLIYQATLLLSITRTKFLK
ncbi:bombesin receptor subtype-3-like [Mya arenaria]|uniref:bombesin receptor subtype-3-like n=1 Tax=Mya arenaria TaxID=6604 RepID=UPI0022E252B3|nr:bombesin receptor subtype-3-like [Mya arenaria]XP_052764346.1 bombesin receptor subtype-3-like [Mya arenaria]XP_052764347.1 bombesin receptor subtype-3-like [Mya arenaria]